jgi:uncharacterized membrane protein YozB (DUF420 family)
VHVEDDMTVFVITLCFALLLTSIRAIGSKYHRNPLAFVASATITWIIVTILYFVAIFALWDNSMHNNKRPPNAGTSLGSYKN